jgi:mRNA interferase HigB
MRLIKRKSLLDFGDDHPIARASLSYLVRLIEVSEWKTPNDVLASASKAKQVTSDRIRFEVAGGQFRAIIAFDWARQIAFVKFVGTHGAYDRVDAATVSNF